jgi:hypothetical protein
VNYVKKLFDDAGLLADRRRCVGCENVFDVIYPDQEKNWWPLGAECSNCNTKIWFSSFGSVLMKMRNAQPENIPNSGPIYMSWISEIENKFLKKLPQCPNCNESKFSRIVSPGEYTSKVICKKCNHINEPWEGVMGDVTKEYRSTHVWYLVDD